MKRQTLFLKIAVFVIGAPVLAVCAIFLPQVIMELMENGPEYSYAFYAVIIVLYAAAIPFFFALYQATRLLSYIDQSTAFSDLSVKALRKIRNCAAVITALFVLCLPFIYIIAENDDAPGMILFGMAIIFGSVVIAVFAAVLQKLLQSAIAIKSENDLTV